MKKYNAILFRGLWGSFFSRGMDTLSQDFSVQPNIDYVIVLPYTAVEHAKSLVEQFRDDTLLFGHSFGVGALLQVAKAFPNREFPLVGSFDPSQYWPGGHTLTPNIKECINFWQDAPLWFIGNQQIKGAQNVHVDTTHIAIEDRRDLHKILLDKIKKLP